MTKYPIILAHGIAIKETKIIHAFGKIESKLKSAGYDVYTANTDAFGSIESNAEQLKLFILEILDRTNSEKVNIIAHSKGGLDSKYMIAHLDMTDKIASLTTICTPHRGSVIATHIWSLPRAIKRYVSFIINTFYKIVGDKNPDSMKVCEQLTKTQEEAIEVSFTDKVYCQSYSAKIAHINDCVLMGIPMSIYNITDGEENDGMVSVESAKFEVYRGECIDESVSHTQIVDLLAKRKNREKIHAFYIELCEELENMGF